ncbi:MAG TPA: hypothetical protein VLZ03_05945 [Thermodesulfobacteriota bacterium]|nr:hypothetical protein [Thermodesulfobacteriota bacterium]
MKKAICLVLFLFVASAASCVGTRQIKAEDDIRETAFRYQFSPWLRQIPERDRGKISFFLSVGENKEDPSNDLMNRFMNDKPAVKARSHATGGLSGVKDRDTGQAGVIFYLSNVKWLSDAEVEVEGAYFQSGVTSSRSTFHLTKKNDKWVVTKETRH